MFDLSIKRSCGSINTSTQVAKADNIYIDPLDSKQPANPQKCCSKEVDNLGKVMSPTTKRNKWSSEGRNGAIKDDKHKRRSIGRA